MQQQQQRFGGNIPVRRMSERDRRSAERVGLWAEGPGFGDAASAPSRHRTIAGVSVTLVGRRS